MKLRKYGIKVPGDLHDKLKQIKKERGINANRLLKDAVSNYTFDKSDLDNEFDDKFMVKNNVDIDIDKYKELASLKIDYDVTIGFLVLCAIKKYIK